MDQFAAEDFVAGFHVGEVDIGEHVGSQGEGSVTHAMPVIEDSVIVGGEEPAAVDSVGEASLQGGE